MVTGRDGMFRVKAVVFDKDGVLADSEAVNVQSAFAVFSARGHALGPDDEREIVGRHPIDYVPVLARRFGIGEAEQQRMVEEQDAMYTRIWREEGRLFDCAREVLAAVRRMGLAVGLATSSGRHEVDEFIARFGLAASFDVTLTLDDVTRAKPDPEMYLSAARRLGVPPGKMLVVEDSEHGVRSAKAAGAPCVAVRTSHVPLERIAGADVSIDSLDELLPLIRR